MPVAVSPEEQRRQLHGWVTPAALAGWQGFARANHTNVTALMEALGHYLATAEEQPPNRLPAFLRDAVKQAQQIAGSRSTRQHRQ